MCHQSVGAVSQAVVSPGGVGFDINCGVRLIRTNLTLADVEPVKERLAQVGSISQQTHECSHSLLMLLQAKTTVILA